MERPLINFFLTLVHQQSFYITKVRMDTEVTLDNDASNWTEKPQCGRQTSVVQNPRQCLIDRHEDTLHNEYFVECPSYFICLSLPPYCVNSVL